MRAVRTVPDKRSKRVIVLTTGGTIAQRTQSGGAARPGFDPRLLADAGGDTSVQVEFRDIVKLASKDCRPEHWRLFSAEIAAALRDGADGVVMLHGTDTMHYTAAALSFMLRDAGKPIVLTGSMIPGGDPGSDSGPNLADAIRVAAFADLSEVCIVFSADDKRSSAAILRGNRARKIHSTGIAAFRSINLPPLGAVAGGKIELAPFARRRGDDRLTLAAALNPSVALVKIHPGLTPDMLASNLRGAKAAILEGTGVGHVQAAHHDVIAGFAGPVILATQTIDGGERLGLYESDKILLAIPNVVPARDMTPETAVVKAMWAIAQDCSSPAMLRADIAGESQAVIGAEI